MIPWHEALQPIEVCVSFHDDVFPLFPDILSVSWDPASRSAESGCSIAERRADEFFQRAFDCLKRVVEVPAQDRFDGASGVGSSWLAGVTLA